MVQNTDVAPELGGDIKLDGTRYALQRVIDDKGNLVLNWRVERQVPVQDGEPGQEVTASWPLGFFGAMGETSRIARNSPGYSFATGIDAHIPGIMRFPPTRTTVTPTQAPTDAPTGWIEANPSGSMTVKAFSFTKDTGGNPSGDEDTVTHNLSVAPVAIIMWSAGKTSDGTPSANYRFFYGFTDGTTERAVGISSEDGVGTPNSGRIFSENTVVFADWDGGGGTPITGTVSDIGTSTFKVTYTDNDANAYIIHGLAIGGPDIQADVTEWALPASTGDNAVTGTGINQADLLIHITAGTTTTANTATGHMSLGAMDANGNQWALAVEAQSGFGTSNTARYQITDGCFAGFATLSILDFEAAFRSSDSDGFAMNFSDAPGAANKAATLSLKGVNARVGNGNRDADSGADEFAGTGMTATALFWAGVMNTTSGSVVDGLKLGVGAATSTSDEQSCSISDKNGVGTTVTDGVDNSENLGTELVFEELDDDGASADTATFASFASDVFNVSWSVGTAANEMLWITVAPPTVSDTRFLYSFQGINSRKMSVNPTTGAITLVEEIAFNTQTQLSGSIGGAARAGKSVTHFTATNTSADHVYVGLGKTEDAVKITTVAGAGSADTWAVMDAGTKAQGFTTQNDGITVKLWRGHTGNKLNTATADDTWTATDSDVGSAEADITALESTRGQGIAIGKEDGLWFADPSGAISERTRMKSGGGDADNGTGLLAIPLSQAAFFNSRGGLSLMIGTETVNVGPDTIPMNREIPNITHSPVNGRHYETEMGDTDGHHIYGLYRVSEASVDRTYLFYWVRDGFTMIPRILDRLDFYARGLHLFVHPDTGDRYLFSTGDGDIFHWKIGRDGSPNAGRDNIGYGATGAVTYDIYGPSTPFHDESGKEYPHTKKRLRSWTVNAPDLTDTIVVLRYFLDEDSGNLLGTITSAGVSTKFWTLDTTDECFQLLPLLQLQTGGGYTVANGTDPHMVGMEIRATLEPDLADVYRGAIDTKVPLAEGQPPPLSAKGIRDAVRALLMDSAQGPITVYNPDGTSFTGSVLHVGDLQVGAPIFNPEAGEEKLPLTYVFEIEVRQWVTS
jgi:hypothetical protein